jgi:two-component system chemotaxis response regulator CheB
LIPPIRVLVIDDSAFARKVMREVLAAEAGVEVVGFARDGLEALEKIKELRPQVVTLDLLMPGLDGVGVLEAIADWPDRPHAIVVTTLEDASEVGVAALAAGAFDVVHKPTAIASDRLYELRPELVAAIRGAALAPRGARRPGDGSMAVVMPEGATPAFDIVVIGASTGGPQAVSVVIAALPSNFPVPIAVVLHMPTGYTATYADRIDRECALEVFEARERLELTPGRVAIARAGMHLTLSRENGICWTHLDVSPLDSLHKPSVDVLFASAAKAGGRVLGVVLTGMGDDGREGARAIRASGGRVIAEAASSCVVYGMPRAVAESGLANQVVPLERMAAAIAAAVMGGK